MLSLRAHICMSGVAPGETRARTRAAAAYTSCSACCTCASCNPGRRQPPTKVSRAVSFTRSFSRDASRREISRSCSSSLRVGGKRSFSRDASRRESSRSCSSSLRVFAASATGIGESDVDSPDTKAVKFLIQEGVSRISALEAYSKASQTAYWTQIQIAENVYEVVDYLKTVGVTDNLAEVVGAHPSVLAYSVPNRLKPAIDYLMEVGVEDIGGVIAKRPSLLGLDPENQVKRVVEYFRAQDPPYTQEQIVELLCTSI